MFEKEIQNCRSKQSATATNAEIFDFISYIMATFIIIVYEKSFITIIA